MPLGNRLDDSPIEALDAYLTVESVNNGSLYVQSDEAVKNYGWIVKTVSWDDVSDPAVLLEKAKAGSLQQLVTLADSVEAPVAAGSQLGTLTITSGEEVVAELPILAGEEIPRVTFGQMLVQMLRTAFLCG